MVGERVGGMKVVRVQVDGVEVVVVEEVGVCVSGVEIVCSILGVTPIEVFGVNILAIINCIIYTTTHTSHREERQQ